MKEISIIDIIKHDEIPLDYKLKGYNLTPRSKKVMKKLNFTMNDILSSSYKKYKQELQIDHHKINKGQINKDDEIFIKKFAKKRCQNAKNQRKIKIALLMKEYALILTEENEQDHIKKTNRLGYKDEKNTKKLDRLVTLAGGYYGNTDKILDILLNELNNEEIEAKKRQQQVQLLKTQEQEEEKQQKKAEEEEEEKEGVNRESLPLGEKEQKQIKKKSKNH